MNVSKGFCRAVGVWVCFSILSQLLCAGNLEPHWLKQVGADFPLKSRLTEVSYEILTPKKLQKSSPYAL